MLAVLVAYRSLKHLEDEDVVIICRPEALVVLIKARDNSRSVRELFTSLSLEQSRQPLNFYRLSRHLFVYINDFLKFIEVLNPAGRKYMFHVVLAR